MYNNLKTLKAEWYGRRGLSSNSDRHLVYGKYSIKLLF